MASHDAGWDAFRSELRHWMELRHFTSRALAMKLNDALGASSDVNLDEHVVKRWRHSTAPPLAAVRHIAAILEMSDENRELRTRVRELEAALADAVMQQQGRRVFAAGQAGITTIRSGARPAKANQVVIWRPQRRD